MRSLGVFLAMLALFAGASAGTIEFVNNCKDDDNIVGILYEKVDDKFVMSHEDMNPFVEIGRGDTYIPIGNESYIEFTVYSIKNFFDEYGSRIYTEDVPCEQFVDNPESCSDLEVPPIPLLFLGNASTVYLCSSENNVSAFRVVNNCPYDLTALVFQSESGVNDTQVVLESEWTITPRSIVFDDKSEYTFVGFVTPVDAEVGYFDQDDSPIVVDTYECSDISPDCGMYSNATIDIVDVTYMNTVYLCAVQPIS
jgi:hypothetical protein